MTEVKQTAQAMHRIENTIPVQTEDGLIVMTISVSMPQECSETVWDSMHNKFGKIVDIASTLMLD